MSPTDKNPILNPTDDKHPDQLLSDRGPAQPETDAPRRQAQLQPSKPREIPQREVRNKQPQDQDPDDPMSPP
jgi:hypothetical protein